MTEKEKIQYIRKLDSEGAYARCETVPISILQKSLITPEEMLLIEFIRKNPGLESTALKLLKNHAKKI